jgi:hypothetical protein
LSYVAPGSEEPPTSEQFELPLGIFVAAHHRQKIKEWIPSKFGFLA